MAIKREECPLDTEGNGTRIRTLEYDIADAPMLRHAMIIASNTALMCGGRNAMGRFQYYRRKFTELCPPGYEHLRREEDLCEIAIAMTGAPCWSIQFVKQRWSSNGPAIIRVSDNAWETLSLSPEAFSALSRCIETIAPVGCDKVDPPEPTAS